MLVAYLVFSVGFHVDRASASSSSSSSLVFFCQALRVKGQCAESSLMVKVESEQCQQERSHVDACYTLHFSHQMTTEESCQDSL